MKKIRKLLHLQEDSFTTSLQEELLIRLREQFNCRVQLKLDQFKKNHILRKINRNIAFIKSNVSKKTKNICKL